MTDVNLSDVVGGGGGSDVYIATAFSMIKSNVSAGAVAAGWELAEFKGVTGELVPLLYGQPTWAAVVGDATTYAEALADAGACAAMLSDAGAVAAITADIALVRQAMSDGAGFASALPATSQDLFAAVWGDDTACNNLAGNSALLSAVQQATPVLRLFNNLLGASLPLDGSGSRDVLNNDDDSVAHLNSANNYLIVGFGYSRTTDTTDEIGTVRSGSSISGTVNLGNSHSGTDESATNSIAIPIADPLFIDPTGTSNQNHYFRAIDCGPAA